MKAPLPDNEAQRLAILREYNVLDSMPEQAFDDLTLLAAQICQTPIAAISLVDEERQWFKSKVGLSATQTSRDVAFCAHAVLNPDEVLEVPDAQLDPRFADNPLVTADPQIRFYAGAPLVSPDGMALGTLCAIDRVPHELSLEQKSALRALSRMVVAQLELRRAAIRRENEKLSHEPIGSNKNKWSLANTTMAIFGLAVLALLIVGGISVRSLLDLGRQVDSVQHSYQIIEQAEHVLTNMLDVQSGQRGYIITGSEEFLDAYETSRIAAQQAVQQLRRVTAGNPVYLQDINELELQVERRLKLAEKLIAIRRTQGFKAAQESVALGVGKVVMDEIRRVQNNIESGEQRQLDISNRRKEDSIRFTLASISIFGGLAIFVVGFSGVRIRREIMQRSAERTRIEKLNSDLETRAVELAAARRRAETSDLFKSAILEHAGHAIISTTPEGIITTFNQAAERMLGYTATELVGLQTPAAFHDPAEVAARAQEFSNEIGVVVKPGFEVFVIKARLGLPNEYEWTYIRKDGTRLPVLLSVTALRDTQGSIAGFLGIAVDISRRKQAEQERDRLFNYALDLYVIAGFDGYFKQVNPAWQRTLGWQAAELLARPYLEFVHPDDREATLNAAGELVEGKTVYSFDNRYLCKDGTYKWLSWVSYPLLEENLIFAVARDISERKQAEQLMRSKNEELRNFAYTVSHDLKAPLRGITGYAQELERRHQEGLSERAQFCITQIINASRNLDSLIEDLLKYSRLDAETPTLTTVHLADLVQSILRDRSHTIAEQGVEVTIDIPGLTLNVWERGLHQVLANLIDNAIKYSRQSQPPRIVISAQIADNRCRIIVTDNGIGFDMKYHDRIFGLFNRLVRADEFEGTGAGLAIVKKLLEKLGGSISADATPGQGAAFSVDLPVLNTEDA